MPKKIRNLNRKCHTPNLLKEVVEGSGQAIYKIPINILGRLLFAVGERASEMNDPMMNALMCQLTIYEIANPLSPDYDPKRVAEIMAKAKKLPRK